VLPAVALAVEGTSYAALYTGNMDDYDQERFAYHFASHGWSCEVNKSTNTANKPHHYHFTHGPYDDNYQGADDADILYQSGHGFDQGFIPIYDYYGDATYSDSISPDTNCTNSSPWEIGVDWAGLFPDNQSRWDTDIEWIIFAGCSQLRTIAQGGAITYADNGPAKTWARTLLGDPARAHAIMGYWYTAPGDGHDYKVVNNFHEYAFHTQYSVCGSWIHANRDEGETDWALVSHTANRYEQLIGVGSGPNPDTTGTYYIDYWTEYLGQRILDGRGGAYEDPDVVLEDSRSWFQRALDWLLAPQEAYADFVDRTPARLYADDTTFEVSPAVRGPNSASGRSFAAMYAAPIRPDAETYLQRGVGRVEHSSDGVNELDVSFGLMRGNEGTETACWHSDGTFSYHSGRGVGSRPVGMSVEEAIEIARTYLTERGELPDDAVLASVNEVSFERWTDLDSADEQQESVVVQYSVRFIQDAGGVFVEGPGTGILVTVGPDGVDDVYKKWFELTPVEGAPVRAGIASAALQEMLDHARSQRDLEEEATISSLDVVLYADASASGECTLEPAWRAELDSGQALYGGAASGAPVVRSGSDTLE